MTVFEHDRITSRWQIALDAAGNALSAASGQLPATELARRAAVLAQERQAVAVALSRLPVA